MSVISKQCTRGKGAPSVDTLEVVRRSVLEDVGEVVERELYYARSAKVGEQRLQACNGVRRQLLEVHLPGRYENLPYYDIPRPEKLVCKLPG
eukprot:2531827-Amphidinium_carterae.1